MSNTQLNTVFEIHQAAATSNLRAVSRILRKDVSAVNLLDGDHNTPLHIACMKQDIKIVELLLKHGANTKAYNYHKVTPLHLAIGKKHGVEIVELLLKHNAAVNCADQYGDTPLHVAVAMGNKKILAALLRSGANLNAMNNEFQMPLSIAKRLHKEELIKVLLEHGAPMESTHWEIIKFSFKTLNPFSRILLLSFMALALGSTIFIAILTAGTAAISIPIATLACAGIAILLIGNQYYKIRTLERKLMNAEITFEEFLISMSLKRKR